MSTRLLRMTALSFAVSCAAAFSSPARAQRLADLQQGARIRVQTRSHGDFVGNLESATSDTVKVRDGRQTLAFSVADSKVISTSSGPSSARGMLRTGVTAGVLGGIAGAAVGAMTYKPCNPDGAFDCAFIPNTRSRATTFAAVSFGVTSLVIGGVVGAIRGSDNWTPVALH